MLHLTNGVQITLQQGLGEIGKIIKYKRIF